MVLEKGQVPEERGLFGKRASCALAGLSQGVMEAGVSWKAAQPSLGGNGSSTRNGEDRGWDLVPDGGTGISRGEFKETDGWIGP